MTGSGRYLPPSTRSESRIRLIRIRRCSRLGKPPSTGRGIAGARVKNLFLRNKKGDRHYLVILPIDKQADLRQLVRVIGDDRLSFGSADRLQVRLGLTPGSVSPFGLINDTTHSVRVIVDADLRQAERLIFHPNDNRASLSISLGDFERFLESRGNVVRWLRV